MSKISPGAATRGPWVEVSSAKDRVSMNGYTTVWKNADQPSLKVASGRLTARHQTMSMGWRCCQRRAAGV